MADEPILVLEGVSLVAVSLGFILASVARTTSRRSEDRIVQLFWHDVGQAGYVWAAATTVILIGALGEVEGLRVPIWLILAVAVGVGCLVLTRRRWAQQRIGSKRASANDSSRPDQPRLVSRSWEIALLGAAGSGLLVYIVSVSHVWGHPIHWTVAGVGMAIGYAIGLIVATPRYSVQRGRS